MIRLESALQMCCVDGNSFKTFDEHYVQCFPLNLISYVTKTDCVCRKPFKEPRKVSVFEPSSPLSACLSVTACMILYFYKTSLKLDWKPLTL